MDDGKSGGEEEEEEEERCSFRTRGEEGDIVFAVIDGCSHTER